jgi:hypothetical protein
VSSLIAPLIGEVLGAGRFTTVALRCKIVPKIRSKNGWSSWSDTSRREWPHEFITPRGDRHFNADWCDGTSATNGKPAERLGGTNLRSNGALCLGRIQGASRDFGLAFQDNNGTLRFIRDLSCEATGFQPRPPAYLEVRRK